MREKRFNRLYSLILWLLLIISVTGLLYLMYQEGTTNPLDLWDKMSREGANSLLGPIVESLSGFGNGLADGFKRMVP